MAFFRVKILTSRVDQNGNNKEVTEEYVVSALSFTEAEANITTHLASGGKAENAFSVEVLVKSRIQEIFLDEELSQEDSIFYLVKIGIISLDEKSGAAKLKKYSYIIQSDNFINATKTFTQSLGGEIDEYRILAFDETEILEVFV